MRGKLIFSHIYKKYKTKTGWRGSTQAFWMAHVAPLSSQTPPFITVVEVPRHPLHGGQHMCIVEQPLGPMVTN